MRKEDLISKRDRDLLLVPYHSSNVGVIQWPSFLLASKIPIALDMAKDFKGRDDSDLFKRIRNDEYMYSTFVECYETLKEIIIVLLKDSEDKVIVKDICKKVEKSISERRFVKEFKMNGLPSLSEKLEKFLSLLREEDNKGEILKTQVVNVLQDIVEIIMQDVMTEGHPIQEKLQLQSSDKEMKQRFVDIEIDLVNRKSWKEKENLGKHQLLSLECTKHVLNEEMVLLNA